MGIFDRLFGNPAPSPAPLARGGAPGSGPVPADDRAVERYRYMIQTAPPETIEQAHQEAFAKLTAEQRRQLLTELARVAPENERASIERTSSEDPQALARIATRAEVRQPGIMERTLGGGGMGFGSSLLGSFAAGFVGSMVAQSFFSAIGGWGGDGASAEAQQDGSGHDEWASADDASAGGDGFGGDEGGGDFGGDFDV